MHRYIVQLIILFSVVFSSGWVGLNSDSPKAVKPTVLSSTIEETYLDFQFEGYQMVEVETPNGSEYVIDLVGGSSILESGSPDLDKWTSSIVIPDEGTTSIEVISSEYRDYENVMVAPSKGNLNRSINPENIEYYFGNEYNNDEFYPGDIVSLEILRGNKTVDIEIISGEQN